MGEVQSLKPGRAVPNRCGHNFSLWCFAGLKPLFSKSFCLTFEAFCGNFFCLVAVSFTPSPGCMKQKENSANSPLCPSLGLKILVNLPSLHLSECMCVCVWWGCMCVFQWEGGRNTGKYVNSIISSRRHPSHILISPPGDCDAY